MLQQKKKAGDEMLKKLNPILGKYMEENNITVVIDKKRLDGNKNLKLLLKLLKF